MSGVENNNLLKFGGKKFIFIRRLWLVINVK